VGIAIRHDFLVEPDETFSVTLSSPGSGLALGSPSTAVVTIVDDDRGGVIAFPAATIRRSERGPVARILVVRTDGLAGGVSVDYPPPAATATAGADFTPVSGTLSFGPGARAAFFDVPLLDDTVVEGDETVQLALSNPKGGASLGAQSTATLVLA